MTTPYFQQHELEALSPSDLADLRYKHARRWENAIRKECHDLRRTERAFVDKNWEAPTVPGRHQKRETSKPDFSGHLTDARHVVFEAKTTLHPTRFDFDNISTGQREHLSSAHACGAAAFVYLLDNLRRRWVLPWGEVLRLENVHGVASLALPESPHFLDESEALKKLTAETWLDAYERLEREGLA